MSSDPKIPKSNHHVGGARALHMEILDTTTRNVWQTLEPVTLDDFRALVLEPSWMPVGIGQGAMDASFFRRSPGAADDGAMETREHGGHTWSFCARPTGAPELPGGPEGPTRLLVDKHHTVIYRAGRELGWIRLPDGTQHVHVIEGGPAKKPLELPAGWILQTRRLARELSIQLPCPATVFFFPNGDSYQGPVRIPEDAFE